MIFDFDGTLVDTAPDIAYHANAVLKKYRFKSRPLATVKKAIGHGVHELLKELGFEGDEDALEEAVADFKKKYFKEPIITTKAYPHVRRMLSGPLKKFKKAIVTNKPQALTDKILGRLDLEKFFEAVIGEGGDFPRKPDPASVRHLIRKLKAQAERSVLIGDSRVDFDTASNAGIGFIHVRYGYDVAFRPAKVRRVESAVDWLRALNPEGKK